MSNDIMPCGCEGHLDNEHLCHYPALEKENAALRGQVEAICRAMRQRDMPAADGVEALDTIQALISAHGVELRGHLQSRADVERLGRVLKTTMEDEIANVERLTRERDEALAHADAAHRDWRAELDGNAALRAEHGARPDESFVHFIARLAHGHATAESWKAVYAHQEKRADDAEMHADTMAKERDNEARLRQVYQDAERLALLSRETWKARAEAAEADNAVMVEVLNLVENDISEDRHDNAHRRTISCLRKDHPGAAMLERLRAAEKVVEAARGNGGGYEDAWVVLSDAIAAYDALKEGA